MVLRRKDSFFGDELNSKSSITSCAFRSRPEISSYPSSFWGMILAGQDSYPRSTGYLVKLSQETGRDGGCPENMFLPIPTQLVNYWYLWASAFLYMGFDSGYKSCDGKRSLLFIWKYSLTYSNAWWLTSCTFVLHKQLGWNRLPQVRSYRISLLWEGHQSFADDPSTLGYFTVGTDWKYVCNKLPNNICLKLAVNTALLQCWINMIVSLTFTIQSNY